MKRFATLSLLLLLLGPAVPGCAPNLQVIVKAGPEANDGRSLYMVVRETDLGKYNNEDYEAVVEAFTKNDPSILKTALVFPGDTTRIRFKPPATGLAIYFLFTRKPGDAQWRAFYTMPFRTSIRINLARNRIE